MLLEYIRLENGQVDSTMSQKLFCTKSHTPAAHLPDAYQASIIRIIQSDRVRTTAQATTTQQKSFSQFTKAENAIIESINCFQLLTAPSRLSPFSLFNQQHATLRLILALCVWCVCVNVMNLYLIFSHILHTHQLLCT